MVSLDWLAGVLAWFLFFTYRKWLEAPYLAWSDHLDDSRLIEGVIIIPLIWLCIWWMIGSYREIYFQSRIQAVYKTVLGAIIGSLGLLFTALSDDLTLYSTSYVRHFLVVFAIHFLIFALLRIALLTIYNIMLRQGGIRLEGMSWADQSSSAKYDHPLVSNWSLVSDYDSFITADTDTLVIDRSDESTMANFLPRVIGLSKRKPLFLTAMAFDHLPDGYTGTPSLRHDLIALSTSPLMPWQEHLKRIVDVVLSIVGLLVLLPLMVIISVALRFSSAGPIFYSQQRVGRWGDLFHIYKFRTMKEDAEPNGPVLTSTDDDRVTGIGKVLRKWRLDELPQLFNVLKGDMSLVGPRPERPFFADQLIDRQPKYALIYQVRPGITSWGQVKYGYAGTIEEILQRFRYDLLYMEHMSMILDLRILLYTLIVLIKGQGR